MFSKRIKNSYGYTLLEVIAASIVLGILFIVAIAGYNKYIEKSKKNYYQKQQELVTQAGKDYFNDNRGYLPNDISEQRCVLLDTLINKKYIDPVKNYDKKACSTKKSKVCVQKISLTKYSYETVLDCGSDYKTEKIYPPSISFELENKDFNDGTEKKGDVNKSYEITMKISDEKYDIKSYKYTIYKEGNTKPFFVVGTVSIKEKTKSYTVKIPFNNSGTFYVEAIAYNEKSKKGIKKSGKITLSFNKMNCETAIKFSGGTENWTNKDINSIISSDDTVSYYYLEIKNAINNQTIEKIQNDKGNYKIDDKTLTYKISAKNNQVRKVYYEAKPYDNKGKNNSCVVKSPVYKIDKIKPVCNVASSENSWTNQNVTLIVQCSDNDSKCVNDIKRIVISDEHFGNYNTDVMDNAGNKTDCSAVTVDIDKTPPNASITSKNLKKEKEEVALKCSDERSGISKYYFGKTNPDSEIEEIEYKTNPNDIASITGEGLKQDIEEPGTYYLSCVDGAGNKRTVNKEFYKTTLTVLNGIVSPKSIITASGNSFKVTDVTTVTPNTGYSFNNEWYKNSTTIGSVYTPSENATLYAECNPKTYTLTLDPNKGQYNNTTTTSTKIMTYATKNNNDIGVATRTGYKFDGWYTKDNVKVYDKKGKNTDASSYWTDSYDNGTWRYDGNIELYAHWTVNKYKVVLVPNKGNLIQNYTFDNYHMIKDYCNTDSIKSNASSTDIHVNGWPTYDLCTNITDYVTSYDSTNKYVTLSAGNRISQQIPDILENDKWYAISVKLKNKTATSKSLNAEFGFKYNGQEPDHSKFTITNSDVPNTNEKIITYVFKLSNYTYNDNYIDNYDNNDIDDKDLTSDERYYKYIASDRPEIYLRVDEGSVDVDDFSLTEAIETTMKYDSEFNLKNITRNGYQFKGWYINNNAANNATSSENDKNMIVSNQHNTLTSSSANCYNLDDPGNKGSACFVYAGWVEKKKEEDGKVISTPILPKPLKEYEENNTSYKSDLVPKDCSGCSDQQIGEVNLYSSGVYNNQMHYEIRANSILNVNNYKYIYVTNDEHPKLFGPGFGGYCRETKLSEGHTYYNVMIVGMGTGLYIHPVRENYKWITDNEGNGTKRLYAYSFEVKAGEDLSKEECVYFTQNPIKNNDDKQRDHMSFSLYASNIYEKDSLPEYYKYLGVNSCQENCTDTNNSCEIECTDTNN